MVVVRAKNSHKKYGRGLKTIMVSFSHLDNQEFYKKYVSILFI